ncbi:hypothetical protein WFZ85_04130 [Flavobacterium sp. j3]|uniref:Uncharacterized protein n=1 Tax=Flavobacterium aureirubrum TaxID=3133147 RepID=A0ABU9N4S7_9FLAO
MKKKELFRSFNFSDGKLVAIGKEKIAYMRRDKIEFEKYGITTANFDALEEEIDKFLDTATDIEKLGTQTDTTAIKDAKAEELRQAIRVVMTRVVLVYEEGSSNFRKFGTETLSKQLDSDLLITGKRVVRVANEFFTALETKGLKADMLAKITVLREELEDLIVDVRLKIAERDIDQQERVEKANAIYETLVKYAVTGQNIWVSTDVAKYNDYIIYNTVSGEAEDETTV